jgi:hypothetical protein
MSKLRDNMGDIFQSLPIIIFILLLVSLWFFSYVSSFFNRIPILNNFINRKFNPDYPILIIFGATSLNAEKLLEKLSNKKYNVVCASRRNSKWFQMVERNKKIEKGSFIWIHCDTRLHRDIDNVFKLVQLWSNNSKIDLVLNMAVINNNKDLLKVPFQTQRNEDDIVIRITGAYNREYEYFGTQYRKHGMGNENEFITNIIGSINLLRISKEAGVNKVMLPKNNLITSDWFNNDPFIEFVDIKDEEFLIKNVKKELEKT